MANKHNPNRGILHYVTGAGPAFSIIRRTPSDLLQFFVRHYWLAEWDFRGHAPHIQYILQHPGVNLLFQRSRSLRSRIERFQSQTFLEGLQQPNVREAPPPEKWVVLLERVDEKMSTF